jgi:hypothetical protein
MIQQRQITSRCWELVRRSEIVQNTVQATVREGLVEICYIKGAVEVVQTKQGPSNTFWLLSKTPAASEIPLPHSSTDFCTSIACRGYFSYCATSGRELVLLASSGKSFSLYISYT